MTTRLVTLEERSNYDTDGAVVFDGDGDGTSGAALWLMQNPGTYVAVTNKTKSNRDLVRILTEGTTREELSNKRIGIFDISAEDNASSLEDLALSEAKVDFVDHHTKDASRVPKSLDRYMEKDGRDNSTSTIAYKIAEQGGVLSSQQSRRKATELAVIGLANDGKESAALTFGGDILSGDERTKLIGYAKAINYGSSAGEIDSLEILRGFVTEDPLKYLQESAQVNGLVTKRAEAIRDMIARAEKRETGKFVMYVLPGSNPEDQRISQAAYSEFLNSEVARDESRSYTATLQLPDGRWRVATRSKTNPNALVLMNRIGTHYSKEAKGRETAAGFDADKVEPDKLYEQLRGAYESH